MDIKKTVINLSDQPLSAEKATVLAKELNCAPSVIPQQEIITQVECAIRTLPTNEAYKIRHETCQLLRRAKPPTSNISKAEEKALRKIKKNKDVVMLKADK